MRKVRKSTGKIATAVCAVTLCVVMVFSLTACNAVERTVEQIARAWKGVPATMYTYAFDGTPIDRVQGRSFQVSRDTRFDRQSGDNVTHGSVVMISLGDSHINHVGSTLILEQDGLERLTDPDTRIDITNTEDGTPWLNNLVEYWRNVTTGGGSKIIMIRSQNSTPLAVYAGDSVDIFSTEIPNSTWLEVDDKYLFVYRCEYTIYDVDLLLD